MKIYTLLATLLTLSSCGLQNQINEQRNKNNQAQNAIGDLQNRINLDEDRLNTIEANLQQSLGLINTQLASFRAFLSTNSNLTAQQILDLKNQMSILNSQVSALTVQLAIVRGYTGIVGIVNPCGVTSGLNQVLLKLSTGQYLMSYSDRTTALSTRLILLQDGRYTTTTSNVACNFTVSGNGTIITKN